MSILLIIDNNRRKCRLKKYIILCLALSLLLSACLMATPTVGPNAPTSVVSSQPPTATAEATAADEITIFAPSSTSSIPLILAVKALPNTKLVLFTNHPQASAQFIKDENTVLVTGLSVGVDMFRNLVPIQVFNASVSGLSYLVGCNIEIKDFSDLKGKEVYLPFEGSPLEETTAFFVSKAGLEWKKDVTPIYAPFDTSTALIKQGKDVLVALGEPSVSAMAGQACFKLGPSYFEEWNKITGGQHGYPQVAALAKSPFWHLTPTGSSPSMLNWKKQSQLFQVIQLQW
jgi:ABC-type nitrate/sulfonate/bicarbonate transport system substrate-binding protein